MDKEQSTLLVLVKTCNYVAIMGRNISAMLLWVKNISTSLLWIEKYKYATIMDKE